MIKIFKLLIVSIHKLIVYFMIFGSLLPYNYLFYFLFIAPLVYLQLQINNNKCTLSELEKYLDNKKCDKTFIRSMLEEYDIYISQEKLDYLLTYILTGSWILGFIRYLNNVTTTK